MSKQCLLSSHRQATCRQALSGCRVNKAFRQLQDEGEGAHYQMPLSDWQADSSNSQRLSCSEIHPQRALSPPPHTHQSIAVNSPIPAWTAQAHTVGYANGSSDSSMESSSEDGIELQELGHVEALEHTVGEHTATSVLMTWHPAWPALFQTFQLCLSSPEV